MPLADALAAADEVDLARELYEQIAVSTEYDAQRRAWAADRAAALGFDETIVSGEIAVRTPAPPPPNEPAAPELPADLDRARELADRDDIQGAIAVAEQVAATEPTNAEPLELLEALYFETGDVTAASEAIGRQLVLTDEPTTRAMLWRRRAKLYRDALGRDAEAYRCLKEAHACSPADPEIAYQLRTAAMVRGEWGLVASLLYREIAAAATPRERGALHVELALIFAEKLEDPAQAQVNFEQALAFDPTIPAARAPLARRYESIGRHAEAAKLYEEAAAGSRPADKIALLAAANRCRTNAEPAGEDLASKLERAEERGDLDAAGDAARALWRTQPGHAAAFRVLAAVHRTQGDLTALTELAELRAARTEVPAERAAAWLEVARLAEEVDHPTEAARAYDRVLADAPDDVVALEARAQLAFRASEWEIADALYARLPVSDASLGADELALRRSIVAERLGRQSDALEQARQAAAASPVRRDLLMRVRELAAATGELADAIDAAKAVIDLVPLDDDEALLTASFALVELYRAHGSTGAAIALLERIVRDHPHHVSAIEQLADLYVARGDWPTATRYLYQLVPLATTPPLRADRLYRLGEAVLLHLGDVDRADDTFLRASDVDPSHVPTLRRLLDVYWRADDPAALVDVAGELAQNGLGAVAHHSLAQAVIAAALIGDTQLAGKLIAALGEDAPAKITAALTELATRTGRFELASASTAITELGHRGLIDLQKLRAAAKGTPVEPVLDA
jgi:tetratricopeptide (TPR) repeat protein